ncbi:DUF4846 domain-containing protein [Treponema sp.]|uniref:DUF4846 domain-containing protein n=1 Tax=Treponema sp. TaxID=166 RepID=UPI00298E747F|nr:DUF4846 domain-containing protein [Treponema sp.]MCR5612405.1 DUF4846 domain-containing protein [Treponema sp.]
MKKLLVLFIFVICSLFCSVVLFSKSRGDSVNSTEIKVEQNKKLKVNKEECNIVSRFDVPDGFERMEYDKNSFAEYLRYYPLKDFGEPVLLYDGRKKNHNVYVSVFDMPLLNEDLIQCADAVIKLRAEYLYEAKRYDEISFHITNGMEVPFDRYAKGERLVVSGNDASWKNGYKKGYGRDVFDSYLKFIYAYAGTYSLSKEAKKASIGEIEGGNFFIYGASPGHVVLVLDVAVNKANGKKIMMLGQSYMPSQEFHVLKSYDDISPWYYVEDSDLTTPEWHFDKGSLKKF